MPDPSSADTATPYARTATFPRYQDADGKPGTGSPPPGKPAGAPRQAGPLQAGVLLVTSCLAVLGAVLIAPVQPRMAEAFAGQAGADVLAPLVLTTPALFIALLAPFAGRLIDAMGRIRIFTIALVCYAFLGTAPLWLNSLPLIVVSRAGVGVAEAAIMTCSTTLLADYYTGTRRHRILGLQVMATSVSAVLFIGVGGALGASSWRTPFAVYAISLLLAVLVPLVLWQPPDVPRQSVKTLPPLDWSRLAVPSLVTLVGGVTFYVPIAELSFRLDSVGVVETAIIGGISAIAAVGTAVGAVIFPRIAGRGPAILLPIAFGLAGLGIVVLGLFDAVPVITVGAVVASIGTGLLLPTLLTWALGALNGEQRGRGTGIWNGCLFIGQFLCPLIVLGLQGLLGGFGPALVLVGVVSTAMAVVAAILARRSAGYGVKAVEVMTH